MAAPAATAFMERMMKMRHLERRRVLFLLLTVMVAAFAWYYFTNVYQSKDSVRGTLVKNQTEYVDFLLENDEAEEDRAIHAFQTESGWETAV